MIYRTYKKGEIMFEGMSFFNAVVVIGLFLIIKLLFEIRDSLHNLNERLYRQYKH